MYAIRMHGRGGQGVVTLAELIALAAFDDGHEALAIPSFGSERMGAPVMSFCRIDDEPILLREPVYEPDACVVCDATLLHQVDLFAGLADGGLVIVNSSRTPAELGVDSLTTGRPGLRLVTLDASGVALRFTGNPRSNGVLLGALAALSGEISIEAAERAILHRFGERAGTGTAGGARAAFELLQPSAVSSRA